MKKIRFISKKAQSILILIYMAIAVLTTNIIAGKAVYELFSPETVPGKIFAVLAGLCAFLILCAFVAGTFVKKDDEI